MGPIFFRIINLQSVYQFPSSFSLQMTFKQFSPFKCTGDLCWPCHKIGQCHPWVMSYICFVKLHSPRLHAKFKIIGLPVLEKKILKVFAIYTHCCRLGLVTWTTNFCSPFLRMFHMKFGFDWPSRFRADLWNCGWRTMTDDDRRRSMGILQAHLVSFWLRWAKNRSEW